MRYSLLSFRVNALLGRGSFFGNASAMLLPKFPVLPSAPSLAYNAGVGGLHKLLDGRDAGDKNGSRNVDGTRGRTLVEAL